MTHPSLLSFVLLSACHIWLVDAEFVVNVKTSSGNVVRQTIKENVTASLITLEYEDWDLTRITQVLDYKSGINVFVITLLGEIDAGQPPVQTICFVTHLDKDMFIEPDSMSKLRQKNQDTVRTCENNLGTVETTLDRMVLLEQSHLISPQIKRYCSTTQSYIFTSTAELNSNAEVNGRRMDELTSTTRMLSQLSSPDLCDQSSSRYQSCLCQLTFSIDWYPCSLKYCKDPSDTSDQSTIKCGIRTCGITRTFKFPVNGSNSCWWAGFSPR